MAALLPVGRLVIGVAIRPSFTADTIIELRDRGRPTRAVDHYLLCRHGEETWEAPIARSEVERLLELLRMARVPLIAKGSWGLDGTGYEVRLGDAFDTARFTWHEREPPPGWEPLGEIVGALERLVSRARPS